MENYVDGKEYFIKGTARSSEVPGRPVEFVYDSGYGTNCGVLADAPGLLLTASEAAAELVEDTNAQIALYKDEIKKLRSENDSLKDAVEVLKEQKKGLEKTIDKHEATIEERTIECNRWEGMYDKASKRCDELRKRNDELTAWYEEANKTASEAAEANDELKAKIAELRTRNAEFEALLKEVTATRDEAIKQNEDLESELEDARHVNEYAVETARSKEKLVGEQRELVKKYSLVIDILIDKITALKKGENDG